MKAPCIFRTFESQMPDEALKDCQLNCASTSQCTRREAEPLQSCYGLRQRPEWRWDNCAVEYSTLQYLTETTRAVGTGFAAYCDSPRCQHDAGRHPLASFIGGSLLRPGKWQPILVACSNAAQLMKGSVIVATFTVTPDVTSGSSVSWWPVQLQHTVSRYMRDEIRHPRIRRPRSDPWAHRACPGRMSCAAAPGPQLHPNSTLSAAVCQALVKLAVNEAGGLVHPAVFCNCCAGVAVQTTEVKAPTHLGWRPACRHAWYLPPPCPSPRAAGRPPAAVAHESTQT